MEARLQIRVQRYGWDRAAADYEPGWAGQIEPAQRKLLELAGLSEGESVADLACGTGLVTLAAARQVGPYGFVTGTDLSGEMVERAIRRAELRGIQNVRFARASADSDALPAGAFDAVLCSLGLMYVPDPAAALSAMYRLCRPGGRAVAAVWGRRSHCGWAGIFPVVDARVKTEVCPMFFQLGTGDALAEAFGRAGFRNPVRDRIETILHYPDAASAVMAAFAGGPVAMAYSRFGPATRTEAHADYLATIEPYRVGDAYHLPGEFVVVRAEA